MSDMAVNSVGADVLAMTSGGMVVTEEQFCVYDWHWKT